MSFLNILPMSSGDPHKASAEDGLAREGVGRYKVVVRRRSFWDTMRVDGGGYGRDNDLASEGSFAGDENTWLLASAIIEPRRAQVEQVLSSFWRRLAVFYILPTTIVLVYAAIPFPLYPGESRDGVATINFWFFLLVFYGCYNAVGLLWITKLFNLFAINWWPRSLGGLPSFVLFWAVSLAVGSCVYLVKDDWGTWTLTWSMLTLCTLAMPVLFGFLNVQRAHRDRSRVARSVSGSQNFAHADRQRLISFLNVFEAVRLPRSYKRFLWFVLLLAIGLGSFALGEAYAYLWLSTLPHGAADALLYVYTWVGLIYLLDWLTTTIIESRIDSYPLVFMFKLYYALTHQVYVRNLYARLHRPEQFAVIQGTSSFLTVIVVPLMMHTWTHSLVTAVGNAITRRPSPQNSSASSAPAGAGQSSASGRLGALPQHAEPSLRSTRQMEQRLLQQKSDALHLWRLNQARSFYLKSWAANVTMAAFLGWCTILYFGPNRPAYPYFDFDSATVGGSGPGGGTGTGSGGDAAGAKEVLGHLLKMAAGIVDGSLWSTASTALSGSGLDSGNGGDGNGGAGSGLYTWQLTFIASSIVWVCELVSRATARLLLRRCYDVRPERALRKDLARFPDLLPAAVVLCVFVGINMLMSTVRLRFH